MNRRQFLERAVAGTAGAALVDAGSALWSPARAADCGALTAGAQLYTIRGPLEQDARAALAALRDTGIGEAELYGLSGQAGLRVAGHAVRELAGMVADSGLDLPCAHVDGSLTGTAAIAELANALGISKVFVALPAEFTRTVDGRFGFAAPTSLAELDALADKLNRVGREYRAHGLTFGYHNHQIEFETVGDVVAYDYLMNATDPELVKIELDVGWAAFAGMDPVEYLHRYAGRVLACHLKDFDPSIDADVPQRRLVAPGAGAIDFGAVLAAMDATGVEHGFIEVDVSDDPMDDVVRGREHLASLDSCA